MKLLSGDNPWATIIIGVLTLVVAGVGGGIVLWGSKGALTFDQYLNDLQKFALAVGLLGIGRGIVAHGKQTAQASTLSDMDLLAGLASDGQGGVVQRTAENAGNTNTNPTIVETTTPFAPAQPGVM